MAIQQTGYSVWRNGRWEQHAEPDNGRTLPADVPEMDCGNMPISPALAAWLEPLEPMARWCAVSVMQRQRHIRSLPTTYERFIPEAVADGARVLIRRNGRRCLEFPDGRFFYESDFCKLSLDFAEFLLTR